MIRQERRRIERAMAKINKIKIVPCRDRLTATSGIGLMVQTLIRSPIYPELLKHLPDRVSHRSQGSGVLALTVIAGHLLGAESVEDFEELQDDVYLAGLLGGRVPAPRTILDYLNDFEPHHIAGLNSVLNTMGKTFSSLLREHHGERVSSKRVLDIDSTYHIHHGEEIEGVAWNYRNEWTLESQSAFSSLGFCHHVWLRSGNTKSGTDADKMIQDLYNDSKEQAARKRQGLDFTRMDSAFCNQNTIKSCLDRGLFFTITANKATTFWHTELEKQGVDWQPWVYTDKELERFQKTGTLPPKIELGRIWWKPSWSEGNLCFPIIVKRTWMTSCKIKDKKKSAQGSLFYDESLETSGGWDYYGVVSNFNLLEWTYQELMVFHQKRASSENMNKEMKYGYRLNNLPCQGLVANRAYFLFAMMAHNMLRLLSLMDDPETPCMSKKTRRKFINFPARILNRSKRLWLKVPHQFYQGVIELIEGWRLPEKMFAHMFSTA